MNYDRHTARQLYRLFNVPQAICRRWIGANRCPRHSGASRLRATCRNFGLSRQPPRACPIVYPFVARPGETKTAWIIAALSDTLSILPSFPEIPRAIVIDLECWWLLLVQIETRNTELRDRNFCESKQSRFNVTRMLYLLCTFHIYVFAYCVLTQIKKQRYFV